MNQAGLKLPANPPDKAAMARLGAKVRKRLATNRAVYRLPTEKAEIFAVGDFLAPDECQRLIGMIDAVAKPSLAYEADYATAFRSSYSGDVDPYDPFVIKIQRRIDDLLGIPSEYGETVQGQRYLPGQQFKSHFDWFHPASSYWQAQKDHGGQRAWTAMAFLNPVEAGGHTQFPSLGLSVEPRQGALLFWNNATPAGLPNEWTLHAGLPVEKGVKYIITKWYRARKWG